MYIRTYTRRWCVCVLMYRWGSLRSSRLQYNVKQPLVYPFLYWCLWNFQCIIQLFYIWAYVCRVKGQYTCHKEHHTYQMIPANQKNGWHIVMMSVAMTMTTWSCLRNALKRAISAKSAFNLRSYPCFTVPSTYCIPMLSVCSFFFLSVPSAIAFKLLSCSLSILTPLIAVHTYTTYSR